LRFILLDFLEDVTDTLSRNIIIASKTFLLLTEFRAHIRLFARAIHCPGLARPRVRLGKISSFLRFILNDVSCKTYASLTFYGGSILYGYFGALVGAILKISLIVYRTAVDFDIDVAAAGDLRIAYHAVLFDQPVLLIDSIV
jgi:hypothetical protein